MTPDPVVDAIDHYLERSENSLVKLWLCLRDCATQPQASGIMRHVSTLEQLFIDVRDDGDQHLDDFEFAHIYSLEDWDFLARGLVKLVQLAVPFPQIRADGSLSFDKEFPRDFDKQLVSRVQSYSSQRVHLPIDRPGIPGIHIATPSPRDSKHNRQPSSLLRGNPRARRTPSPGHVSGQPNPQCQLKPLQTTRGPRLRHSRRNAAAIPFFGRESPTDVFHQSAASASGGFHRRGYRGCHGKGTLSDAED